MLNLIKKKYGVQSSDMFLIQSLNDLKNYQDVLSTAPLYSSHWIFYLEDTNLTGISQEVIDIILKAHKLVLIVGTKNYGSFIRLRNERRWKTRFVETVYASNFTKDEFDYIYTAYTSIKGSESLSNELVEFLKKGYLREPESLFKVFSALRSGISFKHKSDIVSLVGVGNLSPEFELLSILSSTVKTERGLKSFMKKHSNNLIELSHRTKPSTLHRNLIDSCKAILSVKQLISEGLVIAGVQTKLDLPAYESLRVSRYLVVADRIENLSTSKIVKMLEILTSSVGWETELDVLQFINTYVYSLFKKKGVKV